jgi:hypothetical protein
MIRALHVPTFPCDSCASEPFFLQVAGALGTAVSSTLLAQAEEENSKNQSLRL